MEEECCDIFPSFKQLSEPPCKGVDKAIEAVLSDFTFDELVASLGNGANGDLRKRLFRRTNWAGGRSDECPFGVGPPGSVLLRPYFLF